MRAASVERESHTATNSSPFRHFAAVDPTRAVEWIVYSGSQELRLEVQHLVDEVLGLRLFWCRMSNYFNRLSLVFHYCPRVGHG